MDRTEENRRGRGPTAREASLIAPKADDHTILSFLARLFETGFPQRIAIYAATGRGGKRIGRGLDEVPFKPNEAKPTNEKLVEIANRLLSVAREDCDAAGIPSYYVIHAYDLVKRAGAYQSKLLHIYPPGESAEMDAVRGETDDEEAPQKLLKDLLDEQRRHTRWLLEQNNNIMSVVMERQDATDERLNTMFSHTVKMVEQVGSLFGKLGDTQIKYMAATEEALSKSDERKEKQEERQFKREKIEQGIQLLALAVPQINEAIKKHREQRSLTAKAESSKTDDNKPKNPVRVFIDSTSQEQDIKLFGVIEQDGTISTPGIFHREQIQALLAIANADNVDPALVKKLRDSITADQMTAARDVVTIQQVLPLMAFLQQFDGATA